MAAGVGQHHPADGGPAGGGQQVDAQALEDGQPLEVRRRQGHQHRVVGVEQEPVAGVGAPPGAPGMAGAVGGSTRRSTGSARTDASTRATDHPDASGGSGRGTTTTPSSSTSTMWSAPSGKATG